MKIPDNLSEMFGKNEIQECLEEVDGADSVIIIWTRPNDERAHYAIHGMLDSKATWLLEKVKLEVLKDDDT